MIALRKKLRKAVSFSNALTVVFLDLLPKISSMRDFALWTLSTGIPTNLCLVSINKPRNIRTVDAQTVFSRDTGKLISLQMSRKTYTCPLHNALNDAAKR